MKVDTSVSKILHGVIEFLIPPLDLSLLRECLPLGSSTPKLENRRRLESKKKYNRYTALIFNSSLSLHVAEGKYKRDEKRKVRCASSFSAHARSQWAEGSCGCCGIESGCHRPKGTSTDMGEE